MARRKMNDRPATAARCVQCRRRTIRGELEDGTIAEADIRQPAPRHELAAITHGDQSFVLELIQGRMRLTRRTPKDIIVKPAGTTDEQIRLPHRCHNGQDRTGIYP